MESVQIKNILKEVAPDEYMLTGDKAVDTLIIKSLNNEDYSLASSEGGNDFDFSTTLTIMGSIITIIKGVLDIIEKSKSLKSHDKILKGKEFIEANANNIPKDVLINLKKHFNLV